MQKICPVPLKSFFFFKLGFDAAKDKQHVPLSSNYGVSTNVSAPDLPVLNVDWKNKYHENIHTMSQ